MFEGVRKWNEVGGSQNKLSCSLDDKDIEYLEAACLLHNIGVFGGKKGYHKKSCSIITVCNMHPFVVVFFGYAFKDCLCIS